jgi:PPIC-type PPIASE domain
MLKKILKEPIVHFFLIGGLIYILVLFINPHPYDKEQKQIVINKAVLKNLISTTSKTILSDAKIDAIIDNLDEKKIARLTNDYVEDEALYQEALRMGLDKNDFLIKRRLIQKLRFLIEDLNTQTINPTQAQLLVYYNKHKSDYAIPPSISFAHVYFNLDKRGQNIQDIASMTLKQLNQSQSSIEKARSLGDIFPMKSSYGDAKIDEVTAHFGNTFSKQLFTLFPQQKWQGPLKSPYGYHLVKIINIKQSRELKFFEVREKINARYIDEQLKKRNEQLTQKIVKQYIIINQLGR